MRGKIGYACITLLAFGLFVWTNAAVTFYLFAGLVLFALIMWCANLYLVGKVSAALTVTERSSDVEGTVFEIHLKVVNRAFLPAFRVLVQGTVWNCLTDQGEEFVQEVSVAPRGEKELVLALESLFCGRVEVELQRLVVSDFVGVFQRKVKEQLVAAGYAYPEKAMTEEYEIDLSAPDVQNIQNRYLRRKGNDITEILDIRDYQKGDSIKTIHWKLSKKLGRKVVRELDTPANQEVILFLALSEQNGRDPEYRSHIVETASSIASDLLEEEKFFDSVIFEKDGAAYRKYNVEEIYTRDLYERRMLDGNISFRSADVDGYIRNHNVLHKYAFVIVVTDRELAGLYAEYANVRQVLVTAS